jgi:glycosyltransferase involved in cell wall biosynthesis
VLSLSRSPTVVVITASMGRAELRRCAESVQQQEFANVRHLVVVDGAEYSSGAARALENVSPSKQLDVLVLPWNTGHADNYGYRIYGAMSLLVDDDIICFLDDDNWFDADHVSAAIGALRSTDASWAYSLRRIWTENGVPVCDDDSNSLGYWPKFASMLSVWEIERTEKAMHMRYPNLVDTSCYVLPRQVACAVAPLLQGPEADSVVSSLLVQEYTGVCSGKSTVNYALGGGSGAPADWFTDGNQRIRELYGSAPLPWRQTPQKVGPGSLQHPA